MKRGAALLVALMAAAAAPSADAPSGEAAPPAAAAQSGEAPAAFVQAVEFPYYLCPPNLWERELVWLKNAGVETVEFSVPRNWHELPTGGFDFTGRTNPRRDAIGFIRLLRRVGLQAWIGPTAEAWPEVHLGPHAADWPAALSALLAPQTVSHGGPIAWIEPPMPGLDAAMPPAPVHPIAATDPDALAQSRDVLANASGSLLWTRVFDALYPAGWEPQGAPLLGPGAIAIGGEERAVSALRRDALLLRGWAPLLPSMQPGPAPKAASGKFPAGVTAALLVSNAASAVSIVNRGPQPFEDDIRAADSALKRSITIPGVYVAPGEALWLPAGVSLSQKALCRQCSNFSPVEQILYATAELVSIEYENGILAMEFAAPRQASVVLQLERQPVGPFLAAGKPTEFEWDEKTLRARLPIPAGAGPDRHVRIGIAIEEPETSAFFDDARRLVIGAKNVVSTTYSSSGVAARSRLRLPEDYTAVKTGKSPNQIDYEISVPAGAAAGDYANLALEVDGMALGRARLPLFRPLSVRLAAAIALHFGPRTALAVDPPAIAIDPIAGTRVEVALRNNWPAIQTYKLEAAGDGLDIFPPKTEITIGATDERKIDLRIFAAQGSGGGAALRNWKLRVTGAATLDIPLRAVAVPRVGTAVWSADLDNDGSPEWILESAEARAVFSSMDGGRWMEFTWKDGALNFLPEQGALVGEGPVQVKAAGDALQFTGRNWMRTVRLDAATLTIAQSTPLPLDKLEPAKRRNIAFSIERTSPSRVTYKLSR